MKGTKKVKIKNNRQFGTKKDMVLDVITEGGDYYLCNVVSGDKTDTVRIKKESCEILE